MIVISFMLMSTALMPAMTMVGTMRTTRTAIMGRTTARIGITVRMTATMTARTARMAMTTASSIKSWDQGYNAQLLQCYRVI